MTAEWSIPDPKSKTGFQPDFVRVFVVEQSNSFTEFHSSDSVSIFSCQDIILPSDYPSALLRSPFVGILAVYSRPITPWTESHLTQTCL